VGRLLLRHLVELYDHPFASKVDGKPLGGAETLASDLLSMCRLFRRWPTFLASSYRIGLRRSISTSSLMNPLPFNLTAATAREARTEILRRDRHSMLPKVVLRDSR
jgi:hypothetical protein